MTNEFHISLVYWGRPIDEFEEPNKPFNPIARKTPSGLTAALGLNMAGTKIFKVIANAVLAILFGLLGIGALLECRWEAVPLAGIFTAFAVYSGWKTMTLLMSHSEW